MNAIAYVALVCIWSTAPLAIKWSAADVSFAGAIFWRILLSAILGLFILRLCNKSLWGYRGGLHYYAVAAFGIASNFLLVYWASLWLPSGLVSVIFSTTPFVMGVLSWYWLGKQVFTIQRVLALLLAIGGLLVVFADQWTQVDDNSIYGMVAMMFSVLLFSISSIWLQSMDVSLPVLQKTVGGLCFSVPPLALAWWLFDGQLPWPVSLEGGLSILYLSVFGSLAGFAIYYFLLHRLSAYVVSTVGMVSPVFALLLGYTLAREPLTLSIGVGAGLVLTGLTLYHIQNVGGLGKRLAAILYQRP
jgi:drug/metabolite transporter (DMT)-like permease